MSDDHAPFMRGGEGLPVRYVVPFPEPEETEQVEVVEEREQRDRRWVGVVVSLVLVVGLVLSAQWWLRPDDKLSHGVSLVAGLDAPSEAKGGWHAFTEAGSVDVGANVSLGGRAVEVRAMSRTGGTVWQVVVDADDEIGGVELADHSTAGEVLLRLTPSQIVGTEQSDVLVALDLADGAERMRANWRPDQVIVDSDDGRLYRMNQRNGLLEAMESLETVRWERQLETYMWLAGSVELRRHAGLMLLMPAEALRRMNGSDLSLAALDPETGEIPEWLDDGVAYRRFDRHALKDVVVEANVGAGERSITARSWSTGDVVWQRFDKGIELISVSGALFIVSGSGDETLLTRVNPATGRDMWKETVLGFQMLLFDDDQVYLGLRDNSLLVIDAAKGTQGALITGVPTTSFIVVDLETAAYSMMFLGEGRFFVATMSDAEGVTVTARSTVDGSVQWTNSYPDYSGVRQEGKRLLLFDSMEQRVTPLR